LFVHEKEAAPMLGWNTDDCYLLELHGRGVPVIPMRVAAGREVFAMVRQGAPYKSRSAWWDGMDGRDVVVMPTVNGGAWHTVRVVVGAPDFDAAVAALPVAVGMVSGTIS
jgi:hypothetical protein